VALNRSQLVEEIASTTGLTKRQAEEAVDAFVVTIGDQVRTGSKVTIYGFGSFNPTARKARTGRNPRTGQPVKIAASKGIRFSPATGFKADLNSRKSAAKKTAATKASASRTTGRVTATKATKATKATTTSAVKGTARKSVAATKTAAKRSPGRPAKTAPAKKATTKKASAVKATAKKTTAKATAKKATKASKAGKAPAKSSRAAKK
jgi:DNA-binding protein HU-beta